MEQNKKEQRLNRTDKEREECSRKRKQQRIRRSELKQQIIGFVQEASLTFNPIEKTTNGDQFFAQKGKKPNKQENVPEVFICATYSFSLTTTS